MSDIFIDFDKKNEFLKVSMDKIKSCGKEVAEIAARRIINGETDFGIEKIAKDILERKDNAMAMEFTRVIGELIKKNGVSVKITEYQTENHATNKIEMLYGCSIDELDFSEHDKAFEDRIADFEKQTERLMREKQLAYGRSEQLMKTADILNSANKELKQRIAELESKETSELPFDPLECANYLINATYERETNGLERTFHNLPEKVNSDRYTVDDLEQIAEHLLVYCKHNKETE